MTDIDQSNRQAIKKVMKEIKELKEHQNTGAGNKERQEKVLKLEMLLDRMKERIEFIKSSKEHWKFIRGYPNYQVSDKGAVINIETKQKIGCRNKDGYYHVTLYNLDNPPETFLFHWLVMTHFGPPCPETGKIQEIDHINHTRNDNRVENLRWVSKSENQRNKAGHDGVVYKFFDKIPGKDKDIIEVKEYGKYQFENLYYSDEHFYYDTGEKFKQMNINHDKAGYAFIFGYDVNDKRIPIYYNKFKQRYGID